MAKEAMTGFITEFRYFHQMMPVRPLSASAQALWQYLFYRANAAYWQFPLHLQLNELAGALRLSRSSVQRARAELAEQGYLLYEQEPGSRSVKYYLISNVRPHMLMTPEEMLAGSKSYQVFTVAETQVREGDTHVCNESCTRAVSGNLEVRRRVDPRADAAPRGRRDLARDVRRGAPRALRTRSHRHRAHRAQAALRAHQSGAG